MYTHTYNICTYIIYGNSKRTEKLKKSKMLNTHKNNKNNL